MELTEDQKNHIHSTNFWIKSQKNFIENLELAKGNAERMIKNHQDVIDLHSVEIPIEQKFLADGIKNFKDWCVQNHIDPSVCEE